MLRSDLVLEHDVTAELARDAACRFAKITVSVKNGIVKLTGTVADAALRTAAVCAVKRVFGVDGIDQCLELATPANGTTTHAPSVVHVSSSSTTG